MNAKRQKALPNPEWTEQEQNRWISSLAVSAWSRDYAVRIATGYDRLRAAMAHDGEPNQSEIDRFIGDLQARFCPATAATYLLDAWYALSIFYPDNDWSGLRQRCRDIRPKVQRPRKVLMATGPTLCVRFEEWPESQQRCWCAAMDPPRRGRFPTRKEREVRLIDDNFPRVVGVRKPPHLWSIPYRQRVQRGWGMWLAWSRMNIGIDKLPTPETLNGFVSSCEQRRNSTVSVASYVFEIFRAAETMFPESNWAWLQEDSRVLDLEAEPIRDKWASFVPIEKICLLGVTLMDEAVCMPPSVRSAVKFRDGYLLSFMALRPKRVRSVAETRQNIELIVDDEGRPNLLAWMKTKNGDSSTIPYPEVLVEHHLTWWRKYRPLLLGNVRDRGHVWIGIGGGRLSNDHLSARIRHWTETRLGVPKGAHALRTDFATSTAMRDARLVPLIQVMLDQRSPESRRAYQLISDQFLAARELETHQRPLIDEVTSARCKQRHL